MSGTSEARIKHKLQVAFQQVEKALSDILPKSKVYIWDLECLVVEHIFTELPDLAQLPHTIDHDGARSIAGTFITTYADTIWAYRDKSDECEEALKAALAEFVLAACNDSVSRWDDGDVPHVLVEKLTVTGGKGAVRQWMAQEERRKVRDHRRFDRSAKNMRRVWVFNVDKDVWGSKKRKEIRQSKSDSELLRTREQWDCLDRDRLFTREPKGKRWLK